LIFNSKSNTEVVVSKNMRSMSDDAEVKSGFRAAEDVVKSETDEEVSSKSSSDRDDLHKRKNVKMSSGVYDNRLLRAIKNEERRKSARYDRLTTKRQIYEDEDTDNDENIEEDKCKDKQSPEKEDNVIAEEKKDTCAEINSEENKQDQEDILKTSFGNNILDKDSVVDPENVTFDSDEGFTSEQSVENVTEVSHNSNDGDSIKESNQRETEENVPDDCTKNTNIIKIPVRISSTISYDSQGLISKRASDISKDVEKEAKSVNSRGKPPAPKNDRREKLQQYLAEKKKLNQIKRRNEKPAFRPTGKIKYDNGPAVALKPNSYSLGAIRTKNPSAMSSNGAIGSRQGSFVSRSGSCISRSGSSLGRTGSNLSRKNSVGSQAGSTVSKGWPVSSKTNSNLTRTHSTLSRSTLTMIR